MTTQMQPLPVRVSRALRGVINRGGPVGSATRALLIVGAHAAGYDVSPLRHEIAGLLLRADLDGALLDALARCLGGSAIHGASAGAIHGASTFLDEADDPLALVGIEV